MSENEINIVRASDTALAKEKPHPFVPDEDACCDKCIGYANDTIHAVRSTVTNDDIYELLQRLVNSHNDVVEKVNNLIHTVEPHVAELAPTLDALVNHPMLKMFLGKKK